MPKEPKKTTKESIQKSSHTLQKFFHLPIFFRKENLKRCISKGEVRKVKIIYFIVFIALVIIPNLLMVGYWSVYEEQLLSPDPFGWRAPFKENIIEGGKAIAAGLTIFSKIFLAYLTIWVAVKLGIRVGWSVILGIVAMLPLLVWVSVVIILTRKPEIAKQQN